jgi:glycosyltransferase involved in cell wall biosynthesis
MRIGIYSPYLDTVGGGERYMLTIAESLSKDNNLDILLDNHLASLDINKITERISKLLDLNLSQVNFIKAPLGQGSNFLKRGAFLKKYDLIFYLTDGSIFYSTAKKNILHIQSPIQVSNSSFWKKIKSSSWNLIIYNSQFTKENSQKFWSIKSQILYPPVNTEIFKPLKKKKQILTVGRFFAYTKDKKHEVMIKSFIEMVDSKIVDDWSLHLAGGAGEGDMDYVDSLKKMSEGYPIHIRANLEFQKLVELYGQSEIYWHASGFGETDPTKMEHFGITTVEAMSAGAVPVVVNLGGQKEIVENGKNGFLWDTPEDLKELTIKLIKDDKLRKKLAECAIRKSKEFSKEKFIKQINEIVKTYAIL